MCAPWAVSAPTTCGKVIWDIWPIMLVFWHHIFDLHILNNTEALAKRALKFADQVTARSVAE